MKKLIDKLIVIILFLFLSAPYLLAQVFGSPATDLICTACVSDSELASNYSGVGDCGAGNFARTLNDDTAPTCAADDDVPEAGDYSNLTGGGGITNNPTGTINTASQEPLFVADGGASDLTCGSNNQGKMQVMDNGDLQWCDGASTSVLRKAEHQANKNAANGYAGLNGSSKLTASQGQEVWSISDLSDVTSASPTRGDVLVANSTPAWTRLAIGARGSYVGSDGTDVEWQSPANTFWIFDEMCGNSEESGEVGALGWSFTAGSVSQNTALTSGRPCVVGLATTSSSGNVARLFLGTSDTTQMYISNNPSSSDDFDMYTAVSQAATTNRELRFGLFDDMSAAPPANGIYFQMDSAVEAQWHCVTRSGSSESGSNNDSNTNVAGTQELRIKRSGSTITFYIDGTLVCTNTTNIPTANLNIGFQVQTTTNASATMRIDYFWMVGPRL